MEEGREMYYRSTPEKIAEAEECSKIKWSHRCAACRHRAPLTASYNCSQGKQWKKGVGCRHWNLDPEFDPGKPIGIV